MGLGLKNHKRCLKGFKQRGIMVNLCLKDDSAHAWGEHIGRQESEGFWAIHVKDIDGVSSWGVGELDKNGWR